MNNNFSIHPRSSYYHSGTKLNTSKPRSRTKLVRQLKGVEGHLEIHPQDVMNINRKNVIKAILAEMPK